MTVYINGTTGISGVDGSAGTPAVKGTDTDTGVVFGTNTVSLATNGTTALTVDASQNVGIGTSSPGYKLDVQSSASSGAPLLANFQAAGGDVQVYIQNGTVKTQINADATNSASIIGSFSNHPLVFRTNNTDRMRIDTSGQVGIAQTPVGSGGPLQVTYNSSVNACVRLSTNNASTAGELINFIKSTGAATGAITFGASQNTIVYGGTSDYRLKENIAPMTGALATVSALKPCTYTWKSDGSAGQGFIAHELQSVLPDAVVGEKDAVETYTDEDNKEQTRPKYQQIDTSFLVATLTAAIQEQQALITALTARITALEAK